MLLPSLTPSAMTCWVIINAATTKTIIPCIGVFPQCKTQWKFTALPRSSPATLARFRQKKRKIPYSRNVKRRSAITSLLHCRNTPIHGITVMVIVDGVNAIVPRWQTGTSTVSLHDINYRWTISCVCCFDLARFSESSPMKLTRADTHSPKSGNRQLHRV